MSDEFAAELQRLESPASRLFAITPDNSNDLPFVTRALNVAASGAVAIETPAGETVTVYIAAGIAFPVRAKKVLVTGTSATDIVGMH